MCKQWFQNLFSKPPLSDEIGSTTKRALLFGINAYPNSPLNGCINDVNDVEKKLNKSFPGFDIRKFTDKQVTQAKFLAELRGAVTVLRPGDILYVHYSGHGTQVYDVHGDEADGYDEAIYVIDGPIIDEQFHEILDLIPVGAFVSLAFDSCFSGTITKGNPTFKNRFYQMPGMPIRRHVRRRLGERLVKEDMNWVVLSGCSEEQTSADAWIDGRFNGAFTYYFLKVFTPQENWNGVIEGIHKYLPSSYYDQNPTLEGNYDLCVRKVLT